MSNLKACRGQAFYTLSAAFYLTRDGTTQGHTGTLLSRAVRLTQDVVDYRAWVSANWPDSTDGEERFQKVRFGITDL